MLALFVILGLGLYVAVKTEDVFNFLVGGGIAAVFALFIAPHWHLVGGH